MQFNLMEVIMEKFINYLQKQQKHHLAEAERLANEQREDDAVLEKVRANIYGIFISLAQSPYVNVGVSFMEQKMQQIPSAWHISLENAIKHGDFEKETLERVKIAVMADIQATFDEMKGGFADEC